MSSASFALVVSSVLRILIWLEFLIAGLISSFEPRLVHLSMGFMMVTVHCFFVLPVSGSALPLSSGVFCEAVLVVFLRAEPAQGSLGPACCHLFDCST